MTSSVDIATMNGSAISGEDYLPLSGKLEFLPGETSKTILVQVIGDQDPEAGETMSVTLSNPTNATIADGQGEGTIVDDETSQAPVAVDDTATIEMGLERIIDVLANDFDGNGDPLTIISVENPTSGGGSVVMNGDNTLTYQSADGFIGTDSFSYTISDGNGGMATGTVTIDVTELQMWVSYIRFESRRGGKDWRAVFEVLVEAGWPASNAKITYTFGNATDPEPTPITGWTDSNGLFRTPWQTNLPSGSYKAEVVNLDLMYHTWDKSLGVDNDDDKDGLPDEILPI